MAYEYDEQNAVLRQHNRALRSVNRQLRRLVKKSQDTADATFLELCASEVLDTDPQASAEAALEKLRTLGGIDCGPEDYSLVVERCLEALNFSNKASHKPESCTDYWAV